MSRPRGRPRHDDILTPAEWRVVHAVRHGMRNAAIATRCGISRDGVKYHLANILPKLGLADRAALRHWHGAARRPIPQPKDPRMTTPQHLGALGQIARSVPDIGAAIAWYRDVLGLPLLYSFESLAFFDCAGTRLMLSAEPGPPSACILYFRVDDIEAAHARLSGRGVRFLGAPHMIHRHANGTEDWMAFFADPEDRPLALMCQLAPA